MESEQPPDITDTIDSTMDPIDMEESITNSMQHEMTSSESDVGEMSSQAAQGGGEEAAGCSVNLPRGLTMSTEPGSGVPLLDGEDENWSVVTTALMFMGTYIIARFIQSEIRLAVQKAEDSDVEFTWYEMFKYRLDYWFSTSKWAKPSLLLGGTFVLVGTGATMLSLAAGHSISASTWVAWTYVADPGTHADAEGSMVRLVSFGITIGGMLVFALMIGIISDAISEKVDDLKKGKSRVIESDHTLMLGWSDKSLAIIEQIALANESEGGGTVVVLADTDKEEMELTLQSAIEGREHPLNLHGTEVVFRSGNPLVEHDLYNVSVTTARAIIGLSRTDVDPDEADSNMVRQVLSLKAVEGLRGHVVVEMQDVDNRDLINLVAPDMVEVIVAHDIIGRLMIQCAREPGLAYVLESLMGFEGSEFYFEEWPQLVGKTFQEITCRFDDAVPIGVKCAEGKVSMNPENSYVIQKGDRILCLAEDNDTYTVNDGSYSLSRGKAPSGLVPKRGKEKLLFCGWRRDMADMIMQLDEYVQEGSELWLFNVVPAKERKELLKDKGNKEELNCKNLKILNAVGNPIVRRDLLLLKAVDNEGIRTGESITLDEFDSLLILADAVAIENGADMTSSDSRSLASLLIIQDIQRKLHERKRVALAQDARGAAAGGRNSTSNNNSHSTALKQLKRPCDPISEILDTRTRSLLRVANCKGYVMSNHIVSAAIAQVAEDRDLNEVLHELLTAEGSECYIRDISYYLDLNKKHDRHCSFWDVALRARQRREVVVGFKPDNLTWHESGEFILNPPAKADRREWSKGDKVVVLALC